MARCLTDSCDGVLVQGLAVGDVHCNVCQRSYGAGQVLRELEAARKRIEELERQLGQRAEVPECVREWREHQPTRETVMRCLREAVADDEPGQALYERAFASLDWLATTPDPAAAHVVAGADDAEELLRVQRENLSDPLTGVEVDCVALKRASIHSAAEVYVLPRAAVDGLVAEWRNDDDSDAKYECADEIGALIEKETVSNGK